MDLFVACWDDLADPRSGNAGLHDVHELLMIALCAVLCGSPAEMGHLRQPTLSASCPERRR